MENFKLIKASTANAESAKNAHKPINKILTMINEAIAETCDAGIDPCCTVMVPLRYIKKIVKLCEEAGYIIDMVDGGILTLSWDYPKKY